MQTLDIFGIVPVIHMIIHTGQSKLHKFVKIRKFESSINVTITSFAVLLWHDLIHLQ